MVLKVYVCEPCPAVRSVLMAIKALGLELELVPIDLSKGEHLTPEYLKLNPQHTVPTLDDDGFVICDSHAINEYLISQYGTDHSLHTKDPQTKAIVSQRLHFDSGCLFASLLAITKPLIREGPKTVTPEKIAAVEEAYGFLEKFLEGSQWAAGDSVTQADLHLIPSVTSVAVIVPVEAAKYPNITAWLKRAKSLPYYDANQGGLTMFTAMINGLLQS